MLTSKNLQFELIFWLGIFKNAFLLCFWLTIKDQSKDFDVKRYLVLKEPKLPEGQKFGKKNSNAYEN